MSDNKKKTIKLLKNVKLNVSKSGVSTTIGKRGLSVNNSKRGTFLNLNIPGTGIFKRIKLPRIRKIFAKRLPAGVEQENVEAQAVSSVNANSHADYPTTDAIAASQAATDMPVTNAIQDDSAAESASDNETIAKSKSIKKEAAVKKAKRVKKPKQEKEPSGYIRIQ